MARTALTVNEITRTGIDDAATQAAANADGHAFYNGGDVFLVVENTNASTRTVTVVSTRTIDGLAVADLTVDVAQNERQIVGPFAPQNFNQQSGADAGKVYVNFDAVTDLTIAAYRLSPR